jgi:hypothetical protein
MVSWWAVKVHFPEESREWDLFLWLFCWNSILELNFCSINISFILYMYLLFLGVTQTVTLSLTITILEPNFCIFSFPCSRSTIGTLAPSPPRSVWEVLQLDFLPPVS